jgi:hypothetical protein
MYIRSFSRNTRNKTRLIVSKFGSRFHLLSVLRMRGDRRVVVLFSEIARVHQSFGSLDVCEHPEDQEDKSSAEDEKWQVDTKGGRSVERLQGILEKNGEDSEDEGQNCKVEP